MLSFTVLETFIILHEKELRKNMEKVNNFLNDSAEFLFRNPVLECKLPNVFQAYRIHLFRIRWNAD